MRLKVKILNSCGKLPTYGSDYAAGLDLYSIENQIIKPNSRECIPTGISLEWEKDNEFDESPENFYLRIAPRSGLAFKNGIDVLAGVIDYDYRGEIFICFINNHNENTYTIKKDDRIAQLILTKIDHFTEINEVEFHEETQRGVNGFGSTGA